MVSWMEPNGWRSEKKGYVSRRGGDGLTERNRGLLMAVVGAAMWGGSGVAGQYLLQDCGFTTEWLVVTRLLIAGSLLLLLDLLFYREDIFSVWRDRRDAKELIAFALVGMLAVQYTYFASIKYGNAAAGTVLQYLMPIIIVAYTALSARKPPKPVELLCVGMAVMGTHENPNRPIDGFGTVRRISVPDDDGRLERRKF